MTRLNQDFTMRKGENKNVAIRVDEPDGSPKDLTGATVSWKARDSADVVQITKATGGLGIVINDPTNGFLTVSLVPGDTTGQIAGDFEHECKVTDSAGDVEIVTVGTLTLKDSFA